MTVDRKVLLSTGQSLEGKGQGATSAEAGFLWGVGGLGKNGEGKNPRWEWGGCPWIHYRATPSIPRGMSTSMT